LDILTLNCLQLRIFTIIRPNISTAIVDTAKADETKSNEKSID